MEYRIGEGPKYKANHVKELDEFIKKSREARLREGVEPPTLAAYNGFLDIVVTDPALMVVSLDDRIVHRAHAVFDTCTIIGGTLRFFERHLRRFKQSAKAAKIPLSDYYTDDDIIFLVKQTTFKSRCINAQCRMWCSAGASSFGILPLKETRPYLYLAVVPLERINLSPEISEVTIWQQDIPRKPRLLANMKSTNYLLNTLQALTATERDGTLGISIDENGNVLEGPVTSIGLVTKSGEFKTPECDNILASCTCELVCELLENDIASENPTVKAVKKCRVSVDELYEAAELFWMSGDINIAPIIQVDGKVIGTGQVGPVTRAIHRMILQHSRTYDNVKYTQYRILSTVD